MNKWIDFKELRSKLKFTDVLRLYGVELQPKGQQLLGPCPLPNHQGKKTSPSFSVNPERGIFNCFSCGGKGNVLDFAGLMEGVNIKDGAAMRKVVEKLQEEFFPGTTKPAAEVAEKLVVPKAKPNGEPPVMVNQPLDFELKGLDPNHPYLLDRGFLPETIAHFGLGVAARGFLQGRLAIPLHDADGNLIGYTGRLTDDSKATADNPRFLFPEKRERDGEIREFSKSEFLYNGHRIKAPVEELIVVEGFANVWWLHQCEYPGTVGLIGTGCSDRQSELLVSLVSPQGRLWILPGADEIGEFWAESILKRVACNRFCRWIRLPAKRHPSDFSGAELKGVLNR